MTPQMKNRLQMTLVFGILPGLFVWLVFLPAQRRMNTYRQRIETANAAMASLPRFTPLSADERQVLEAQSSEWRQRISPIQGDYDRLVHYHRVVTGLSKILEARGLQPSGIRSSWDPIQGSYTLPSTLSDMKLEAQTLEWKREDQLQAWVLEAVIPGPTGNLLKALQALPQLNPLLEPIGIRWQAALEADREGHPLQRRQSLLLRNLVWVQAHRETNNSSPVPGPKH